MLELDLGMMVDCFYHLSDSCVGMLAAILECPVCSLFVSFVPVPLPYPPRASMIGEFRKFPKLYNFLLFDKQMLGFNPCPSSPVSFWLEREGGGNEGGNSD